MIRPKALIFDYGNVLCEPQRSTDINAMASTCGVQRQVFERLYWELREDFDRGDYDAVGYWSEIAKRAEVPLTPRQIDDATRLDCESWARPDHRMLQWVEQVRLAGMQTAILSNMPLALRQYLEVNCDWLAGFEHKIFSCDVHSIKPDEKIYRHCLQLQQLKPEETLFLDDKMPNVEAAQKIGIHSSLFTTLDKTLAELEKRFHLPRSKAADCTIT